MKSLKLFFNKTKYLLLSVGLLLCFGFCAFTFNPSSANALAVQDFNSYLPLSSLEQKELSSPLDVYYDENVSAILSGNVSHQSLTVYKDSSFTEITQGNFTALKKIDRLASSLVLVDNALLKTLDINDLSAPPEELNISNNAGGCTTFDIFGNYLATIFGNKIFVYEWDGQSFSEIATSANASADTVLACNSSGVFYLSAGAISYSSYENFNSVTTIANVTPSHLIANDEFVYYVSNNEIYKATLDGEQPIKLTKPTTLYDLGDIKNINGFAFKGKNLLITDSLHNTVQEFSVSDNKLVFTGFAICKNKTAYNRISNNSLLMDYSNGKIAVLDENKLTIINDNAKDYAVDNFINVHSYGSINDFALGNETLLVVKNKDVSLIDLSTNTESNVLFTISTYCDYFDVCFRNGTYYVLSHNKNALGETFVTLINEKDSLVVDEISYKGFVFTDIEVDLYGNYYFLDDAKMYAIIDGNVTPVIYFNESGISKPSQITTDFAGKLYAVISNKLYCFNHATRQFNLTNLSVNINNFALSFESKTIFFTNGQDEYIYKTDNLNNSALSALTFDNTYVTNAPNADVSTLKKYAIKDGSTIFGYVKNEQNPKLTTTLLKEDEYLLISRVKDNFSDEYFLALIGKTDTVLVREKDTELLDLGLVTPKYSKVYITTPVHAYYFPKLTMTENYIALKDGERIKLNINEEIFTIKEITFNDTVFYFATIIDGDLERTLYIPKSFTSHKIESVSNLQTFTLVDIKQTTIYLDNDLTTSLLSTQGTQTIRLFEIKNGVALIEIYNGENWVKGYVSESYILNTPNTAIRNILIVLAVIACMCGSITYYILRKKRIS